MLSPVTTAILFGVALLVVGPKKLPEIGKALGQALGNFKKQLNDAQNEVKTAMDTESEPKGIAKSQEKTLVDPIPTAEEDPKKSSG
jgi:TatA/E family protein of Tat protein translocase